MLEYEGKQFLTEKDLQVSVLGFTPQVEITRETPDGKLTKLREYFENTFGRTFLGADELIAYSQSLVSKGIDFAGLEKAMAADIDAKKDLKQVIFDKTATGIGRGHSLGGLAEIELGISGTKMIDSGLTGFCMSRSLATSGRRRATTEEEIVIPTALASKPALLKKYIEVSRAAFQEAARFKTLGNLSGVESFNKAIPYNNPANLIWKASLETLAGLYAETRRDSRGERRFLPTELHTLAEMLPDLTDEAGMGVMFRQRVQVPRGAYLHFSVFKNPSEPNYALEKGVSTGMEITPQVTSLSIDSTPGFRSAIQKLKKFREGVLAEKDPAKLQQQALQYVGMIDTFVSEYNSALNLQITDSLSFRVWNEQKRHSTLNQHVESVESASNRAYIAVKQMFPMIERVAAGDPTAYLDIGALEKVLVIDERIKNRPELLIPYVVHSARSLMLSGEMLDAGIDPTSALYAVPRNIRLRTLENYTLANLIELELPLRLCSTCEPERLATTRQKRKIISDALPELKDLLAPKCSVGYCTEGKPCGSIIGMREGYTSEFHTAVKQAMLGEAL